MVFLTSAYDNSNIVNGMFTILKYIYIFADLKIYINLYSTNKY